MIDEKPALGYFPSSGLYQVIPYYLIDRYSDLPSI